MTRRAAPRIARILAGLLALVLPSATRAASPPASAHLTMALAAAPTSLDPQGYIGASNLTVVQHLYEALVGTDATGKLQPALATAWHPAGDHAWDFTLRPGVRFHNGQPFAAEDVIASFARATALPMGIAGARGRLREVRGVERLGPLLLRIHTTTPAPQLPYELAAVMILPRDTPAAPDAAAFNDGRRAIGTGPFRYVAYAPGNRLDLRRNPDWWGAAPHWAQVSLRFIPQPNVRAAALLAGDADVIEDVAAQDVPVLRADPAIAVTSAASMQALFLRLNFTEGKSAAYFAAADGTPLATNPLRDLRVRRALSLAIDRDGIAGQLFAGTVEPTSQIAPAGAVGHVPDLAPPPWAPDEARRLLAEAGFPDGLRVVLQAPSDRLAGASKLAEAIAQMWSRIGVAATVATAPWATYVRQVARQDFALAMYGCCGGSWDAGHTLYVLAGTRDPKGGRGSSNHGRYSNPALDALLDRANASFDPPTRDRLQREAARLAAEDVALIPLFQLRATWAARRPIHYIPRQDTRSLAIGAMPGR